MSWGGHGPANHAWVSVGACSTVACAPQQFCNNKCLQFMRMSTSFPIQLSLWAFLSADKREGTTGRYLRNWKSHKLGTPGHLSICIEITTSQSSGKGQVASHDQSIIMPKGALHSLSSKRYIHFLPSPKSCTWFQFISFLFSLQHRRPFELVILEQTFQVQVHFFWC